MKLVREVQMPNSRRFRALCLITGTAAFFIPIMMVSVSNHLSEGCIDREWLQSKFELGWMSWMLFCFTAYFTNIAGIIVLQLLPYSFRAAARDYVLSITLGAALTVSLTCSCARLDGLIIHEMTPLDKELATYDKLLATYNRKTVKCESNFSETHALLMDKCAEIKYWQNLFDYFYKFAFICLAVPPFIIFMIDQEKRAKHSP